MSNGITMELSPNGKSVALRFPYSKGLVQVVRGLPSRRWDPEKKAWMFPPSPENLRHLFSVTVFRQAQIDPKIVQIWKDLMASVTAGLELEAKQQLLAKDTAEPDCGDYAFKTMPYRHQKVAFSLAKDVDQFALLMDMGTGKTKIAIDLACYAWDREQIGTAIVVCPKQVATTWVDEIPKHATVPSRVISFLDHGQASRERLLEEVAKIAAVGELPWVLINYDVVKPLLMNLELLSRGEPLFTILDESSYVKNKDAQRTKACIELGNFSRRRCIMTGTPIANSPLDLWSQFYFLDPQIIGYENFYAYRSRYAIIGGVTGHEIASYQNIEELTRRIHRWSYRVRKDDCLDLPEKIWERRVLKMSKPQEEHYERLANSSLDVVAGKVVLSQSVLTQILRMRQITSGHAAEHLGERIKPDGTPVQVYRAVPFEGKDNVKLDEVRELVPEIMKQDGSTKIVVWCTFEPDIKALSQLMDELKLGYVVWRGGMTSAEQESVKKRFSSDPSVQVFLGMIQAGGFGLNFLTSASYCVYYSYDYSLVYWQQSQDRLHRLGQKKNVTYIVLACENTVDESILDILDSKKDIAEAIADRQCLAKFVRPRF